MSIYLTQEDRNQASAATFAEEIKPTLHKFVNPATGERKGQMKGIMKPKKYPVYPDPEDFPRRYFVSDPRLFNQSLHNPGKAPGFRFVINGEPALTNAGISKFFYPKPKKGGKKSHKKKTGRNTGRKTYKRRH